MAAFSQNTSSNRAVRDAQLIESSGAWAKEARTAASDRAQAAGLPQRRDDIGNTPARMPLFRPT